MSRGVIFRRWFNLVMGFLVMVCLGTVYSWSVFRIAIEKHFGVDATTSGLPYMVSLLFYALFMVLVGRQVEHRPPRVLLRVGGALVAAGWILSAIAPSIMVLTISFGVLVGAGVGIAYGVPMSVVAKWFPERRGTFVGMVLMGFGLSPIFTAPLARYLIREAGLSRTFIILGIAFAAVMLVLSFLVHYPSRRDVLPAASPAPDSLPAPSPSPPPPDCQEGMDVREMLSTGRFARLYANFFIGAMIGLTMIGITGNIALEVIGLEPHAMAYLLPLFALCNGIGRPLFGWLTDRISPRGAMTVSFALIAGAAALMLSAGSGDRTRFIIAFSVLWMNLGAWLTIAPAATMRFFGTAHYPHNYGVVFSAYGIGAVAGGVAAAMISHASGGYHYLFQGSIVLAVIGMTVSLVFSRHSLIIRGGKLLLNRAK
jgi:MFS transporter, OFA family, oxalate/formate antiporter